MKQISLAALALVLFSVGPPAGAQTSIANMTVDSVGVTALGGIEVTGVVEGDAAPSTRTITFSYATGATQQWARESCHRSLLLALSKPGQYVAKAGPGVCIVSLVAP